MPLSAALRRLLPGTLRGRVLLVVLAGLVVAHVTSVALFLEERARAITRYEANEIATRLAESIRLGEAAFADAGRGTGPRSRVRLHLVDALPNPPASAAVAPEALVTELRRRLAEELGSDPLAWVSSQPYVRTPRDGRGSAPAERIAPSPDHPPPPRGTLDAFGESYQLTLALTLPDGRLAVAEARSFRPSLRVPADAWISIAVLFLVTTAFCLWAARLALAPVRMLASAAERLSRNLDEPPLEEAGAQEIRDASHAFNRMQERLRRHVKTRTLAFAAMSHDMRTPLTRMRLRLEFVPDDAIREKLSGDLDEIESLTASALSVTRDLSQHEKPEMVDLRALAETLAADQSGMGHEIRVAGAVAPIEARPLAIRRAVGNLVDNAVKHGTQVAIELLDADSSAVVRIIDRGPGIPEEELGKVFDPYYRVESSRNRESGGSGLGLAIAKDVAEAHGGELTLANREGGGLVATLKLPRSRAASRS